MSLLNILKRVNLEDINKTITQNFHDNIGYLQQYHPKLFEKLSAFDLAVENGHYQEKYELVFENDNFDVLEKNRSNYLYNKKTSLHTKKSAQSVDHSKENNCFEGFVRQDYSQEEVDFFEQEKRTKPLHSYASYVAKIIHTTNKRKKQKIHTLNKFVFFGVGLGLHISEIHSKIDAKVYLIVEDDLELFRLSLFCTNYKKIAQTATLFFSVFDADIEFSETAEKFLKEKYFFNHYIKYFQLLSHTEEKANKFYLALASQPDLKFLFHDYLKISTTPLETISKHYQILLKDLSFTKGAFKNKPFLILASGPSLQKNLSFLQNNKNKFIIVAVSSTLSFLEQHNIKPDIIVHLDPFDPSILSFEKLKSLSFIDDALLFMAASAPQKLFSMLKKENIFVFEAGSNYKCNALNISAPCVGSITYMLLLVLKASEIYMLGLDLAVDSETGLDHTEIHQDTKTLQLKDTLHEEKSLSYKEDLFKVDGNFHDKVFTTPHFFGSINIINRYFHKLIKPFQHIYNMSDGAYYNHTQPLKPQEVHNLQNIPDSTRRKLKQLISKHVVTTLSQEEKNLLQNKLLFCKSITNQLQEYTPPKSTDPICYAEDIYNIICSKDALYKYEIARVLDSYLYYILNFIYDYLDDEQTTLQDITHIHKLLTEEIVTLVQYHQSALEAAIKEL